MTNQEVFQATKDCIIENEINGDFSLAYKFSDPDGLNTGKSGYSFGYSQFDIRNNWTGILCLKDCEFKPCDLERLFKQQGSIIDLDIKLSSQMTIVDNYDNKHIKDSLNYCVDILNGSRIELSGDETLIHIVDYHNQFFLSNHGKMHLWLIEHGGTICPEDILEFKLDHTLWGKKRPDDVKRRYSNIRSILS